MEKLNILALNAKVSRSKFQPPNQARAIRPFFGKVQRLALHWSTAGTPALHFRFARPGAAGDR